jgi:hypothetical protein
LLITWCRNHGRLFKVLAHRPDPDDASAQIDLIGVPWMIISREPSAAPNGGYACPTQAYGFPLAA